jgi:hypothetical protein
LLELKRDIQHADYMALANTVHLFEAGLRQPTPNNLAALRRALEVEGIKLLFDESGAAAGIARQTAALIGPHCTHARTRSRT